MIMKTINHISAFSLLTILLVTAYHTSYASSEGQSLNELTLLPLSAQWSWGILVFTILLFIATACIAYRLFKKEKALILKEQALDEYYAELTEQSAARNDKIYQINNQLYQEIAKQEETEVRLKQNITKEDKTKTQTRPTNSTRQDKSKKQKLLFGI